MNQIRDAQSKGKSLLDANANKPEPKAATTKSISQEMSDIVVYCRVVPLKVSLPGPNFYVFVDILILTSRN